MADCIIAAIQEAAGDKQASYCAISRAFMAVAEVSIESGATPLEIASLGLTLFELYGFEAGHTAETMRDWLKGCAATMDRAYLDYETGQAEEATKQ